jgi:hypothetical protein
MQRSGYFLATVVLVLLTLFCLLWTGKFQARAAATPPRAYSQAPTISQAEWRYRQSQIHHWRQMLMPMR